MTERYGRRAEIALTILHDEEVRLNLVTEIRDMNTVIAGFPPRKWWLADHQAYFNAKLARDQQVTALDRELGELRLEERRMYEAELEQARASGKPLKPFHREALLNEIRRLQRKSGEAVTALKEGIESAAQEGRTTRARCSTGSPGDWPAWTPPPAVEREFVPKFIKYGTGGWMEEEGDSAQGEESVVSAQEEEHGLIQRRAVLTLLGSRPSGIHRSTDQRPRRREAFSRDPVRARP